MNATVDFWQLLLVDILFLLLAGSLGLWFRSWLLKEKVLLDDRLLTLEQHQSSLERIASRLQSTCQRLELLAGGETEVDSSPPSAKLSGRRQEPVGLSGPGVRRTTTQTGSTQRGSRESGAGRRDAREERYDRARELLARGKEAGLVARQLGLGIAEVELMERILRQNTPR